MIEKPELAKTPHQCHVPGCGKIIPPSLLMCWNHWRLVPKPLKDDVWAHYRRGQEFDKNPTRAYLDAAKAAIEAVQALESRDVSK